MCGDLLKTSHNLLSIQMTSVCLGKDSILDEQSSLIEPSVIGASGREELNALTQPYQATEPMNWGNWLGSEGVSAHTLFLEIYREEV